jgi:hypothetical protein
MKHYVRPLSAFAAVALAAAWVCLGTGPSKPRPNRATAAEEKSGGNQETDTTRGSSGLPPLVVDKNAPLLLEPTSETTKEPTGRMADNSACYVCHENYRTEPLVGWHAPEDIGCVDCHGPSFAHRNDENNITPPDVMFPLEAIDRACEKCHRSHDVPPQQVLARFRERCPEKADPATVVCTDCHGQHRLPSRTVRWDKKTRKLITSD